VPELRWHLYICRVCNEKFMHYFAKPENQDIHVAMEAAKVTDHCYEEDMTPWSPRKNEPLK
jgi:hypothetical protein